jgi:hypothetical protein
MTVLRIPDLLPGGRGAGSVVDPWCGRPSVAVAPPLGRQKWVSLVLRALAGTLFATFGRFTAPGPA